MTRDVTVQFEDGSSHVYANAPDDITPEQVTERAQKEFSKKVTHLDGGKKAPTEPAKDDHTSDEYEAPLKALGINAKGVEKSLKAVEAEPWWKNAAGVGEAAVSQATGLGSTILGGLAGGAKTLGALAGGAGLDEATRVGAETIQNTQERGTYQPKTATGKAINETVNYAGGVPGKIGGAVGGAVGEAVGGEKGRIAGESVGEALPSMALTVAGGRGALKNAPEASKGNTRGERLLRKAMADFTPEEIAQADRFMKTAVEKDIPLTGPQAFEEAPKLHALALKVDKSNPVVARFLKDSPEKARAAIKKELVSVGEKVGLQAAADTTQDTATKVISDEEKARTAAVKPAYDAAKAGDKEALQLMDDIAAQTADIDAGTKWKNDAVQQAGRWYKFTHDMGLKANEVASKMKEWTAKKEEGKNVMYHGGTYEPGKPIEGVLYLTDNPDMANSYVKMSRDRGVENSKLVKGSLKASKEAPEHWVEHWAKHVGIDPEEGTPASMFDKEIHGDAKVNALVKKLVDEGFDHAKLDDVSYGSGVSGKVTIAFPNAKVEPVTSAGRKPNESGGRYAARFEEGKAATQAAVDAAAERQGFLDKWKGEVDQKADELAAHKLPEIQEKVRGFMSNLDEEIKLAHPESTSGKILTKFKESIAPNGEPLTLPSQLESAYKTARSALDVGINSTSEDRQASGVLKDHVKSLDALIKDVSPEIKAGRELYKSISDTVIDPLKKGPIGKLAGKGADAQKEASHTRMISELQSDTADPTRIAKIADEFNKVDKTAFPNAVRAWLELKFDKAAKATAADPKARLTGSKLADMLAGTPNERANLSMAVRKVAEQQGASPAEARKAAIGVSTFLQTLRATGRVAGLGLQGAEESNLGSKVAAGAAHPNTYGAVRAAYDTVADFVNKGAYENLANIFTDPEAVQKMVKLAGLKAENKAARQAMVKDILKLGLAPTLAPNQPTAQGQEPPLHVDISGLPPQ